MKHRIIVQPLGDFPIEELDVEMAPAGKAGKE